MRNKRKISARRRKSGKRSGVRMREGREGRNDMQLYCVRILE